MIVEKKLIDVILHKLKTLEATVEIREGAEQSIRNLIATYGFSNDYGVRRLNRTFQEMVGEEMARLLISKEFTKGSVIIVDFDEVGQKIELSLKRAEERTEERSLLNLK